jgi:hypothetical protein
MGDCENDEKKFNDACVEDYLEKALDCVLPWDKPGNKGNKFT